MPEKYTHFVADEPEQQQQFSNFVPDDGGLQPIGTDNAGFPHYQGKPDSRNALQRVFDESTKEGYDGALVRGLFAPVMHPQQTIEGIAKTFAHPKQTANEIIKSGQEHPGETFFNFAGGAVGSAGLGGLADRAITDVPAMAKRIGPYKSPVVPAIEANSERLAKAILPSEGVTPSLVKALQRETPSVVDYAKRTGNPLRTIPEGMKAAEGVANEGYQHYRSNLLDPNAEERVTLENGQSSLGHSATLGQIEKRISDINDLTRGAMARAKSSGAEMTAAERLGLENEGKFLRGKLYTSLSSKTGLPTEDIQALREGYGGEYALKNALESGHYNRLSRAGYESQGTGAGIPVHKASMIDRAVTALRGGPEAIANRQFRSAISKFEPSSPFRPVPNPPTPQPFTMGPVADEMAKRIGAIGTDEGVQRPMASVPKPPEGPMRPSPAIAEAQRVSKALEDEQNAAFHAKRAERWATRGKRLNP